MSRFPCRTDSAKNMNVIKRRPAIRTIAADQTLANTPRQLTPEEAKELAEKGYQACLDEGLPVEYAESFRSKTEEILRKPF